MSKPERRNQGYKECLPASAFALLQRPASAQDSSERRNDVKDVFAESAQQVTRQISLKRRETRGETYDKAPCARWAKMA